MSDRPAPSTSTRAIFLSYASQDAAVARRISDSLSAAGLEVWFDQSELRGGDAWDQKIRRQIKECALFTPVISEYTQTRAEGYFRLEWHLAEQRTYLMAHDQPFIVPVVVDETLDSVARVPERFRERQWTRLPGGNAPPDFVRRIQQLLDAAPSSPHRGADQPASGTPSMAASAHSEKSVAVLAFANLSGDKDNEYFSDGVSDELLTVLQRIPGLRVAARTSAFSFKGKSATAQEMGAKLGVANLIEGSVQKSGNRVKISARMSRVSTGEMHWSRSYTREITDVFALQEELALAIVGELRGKLESDTGEVAALVHEAARGGTKDPEAYQQYLMGRFHVNRFSSASMPSAIEYHTRAVQLDPSFALAWASLARAHTWVCGYEGSITREQFSDHLAKARAAADRALALEPELPLGLYAHFWIQLGYDYDWKGGAATARRALELAPTDPDVLDMAGTMASSLGDNVRALELARRAVALDPINPKSRVNLALALNQSGLYAEARAECARYAELNPTGMFARSGIGFSYLHEGRYAEAEKSLEGGATDWSTLWVLAVATFGQGKVAESDAALEKMIKSSADTAAIQISTVFAFRGEIDRAFEWLDRARQQRDPGVSTMARLPLFKNLHSDPRWSAFWHSLGVEVGAKL